MLKLYEGTLGTISEGEIVKGRIVAIGENEVSVDIGFKSEGVVSLAEFTHQEVLKVGDEIEVFLESVENKEGQLVLSRKRADFMRVWERVTKAFTTGEVLQGRCVRRIKGGIVVDLLGIDAFLPGSQIDVRPVRDFDAFIGRTMDFRVVKINHPSENVVVSHKVLVEEEMAGQRKAIIESLEKGQILEGSVKAITDFGVFVDLGGVDGLVHITDLSWGRVNHPSEIVKLDQTINVVVLDFDQEKKRISLGYKQLQPHPWENIQAKYPVGTKVTRQSGIACGLRRIHRDREGHRGPDPYLRNELDPAHQAPLAGRVDGADGGRRDPEPRQGRKEALARHQAARTDPWLTLMQKYPVGSRHTGIVRNLTNFGVFVELEQGVDGLIHISDLSWTKKVRHPGEIVKKGDEIEVLILGVDVDQRRISLGHKQIDDNPWEKFGENYKIGTEVEGKIVRIIEKGVIVELPLGVDGFVPISQLAMGQIKNIADKFKIGDPLPLRVVEFDKDAKKIVLSAVEFLKGKETRVVQDYMAAHKLPGHTVADLATIIGQTPSGDTSIPKEN